MRNLLRNKYIVAGLVVLAMSLISWRVRGFLGKHKALVTAREPARRLVPPQGPPEAVEPPASRGLRAALAGWPDLFPDAELVRDPFAAPGHRGQPGGD